MIDSRPRIRHTPSPPVLETSTSVDELSGTSPDSRTSVSTLTAHDHMFEVSTDAEEEPEEEKGEDEDDQHEQTNNEGCSIS